MKKLLLLFLTLTISFANAQDKGYWVCFNVNVDAEGQEAFVNALDGVFNSEFSSQFPFAVTLNEIMFTSRENKMTHQLCFLAPNAETMDMWGGGHAQHVHAQHVVGWRSCGVGMHTDRGMRMVFDPSLYRSSGRRHRPRLHHRCQSPHPMAGRRSCQTWMRAQGGWVGGSHKAQGLVSRRST